MLQSINTLEKRIKVGEKNFVHSASQGITFFAYGDLYDIPFRMLNYQTECEDYKDFTACLRIIDSYNEFDADLIIKRGEYILNKKRYYNENNPNNGNNMFKYKIGREGSPVFYITLHSFPNSPNKAINGNNSISDYSNEDFKKEMQRVANIIKCDEFSVEQENEFYFIARFWFD